MTNKERRKIKLQNKFDDFDLAFDNVTMDFFEYKATFNKKSQKQLLKSISKLREKISVLTKDIKSVYFIEMEVNDE